MGEDMEERERKYLTPSEVSERFKGRVSLRTLANWRYRNKGPAFLKLGGRVLYERKSLETWEDQHSQQTRVPGQ